MFIDLEDDFPNKTGVYKVLIKTAGGNKESLANWTDSGFILVDDELGGEEYIFAWLKD